MKTYAVIYPDGHFEYALGDESLKRIILLTNEQLTIREI